MGLTPEDVLEGLDAPCCLVYIIQPRNLDEPPDLVSDDLVVDHPLRELVPLVEAAAVDREPPLAELVLALPEVLHDLVRELGEVAALDEVVRLEEDLTQAALPDRIVLQVELVEALPAVLDRMHVERVDREVVRGQLQRLENLLQGEFLPVTEDDNVLQQVRTEKGSEGGSSRLGCASFWT
jgi:hypothetical protein